MEKIVNNRQKLDRVKKPNLWLPVVKELGLLLGKIVSVILIFVLLLTFQFGFVRYQDLGMSPIIKDWDLVIFYRYNSSGYQAQDVVVVKFNGQNQVSRVIATAGDTVDIVGEDLFINGALQQEANIFKPTYSYSEGIEFPITVPEGYIFVLGDNRTNSTDSRLYGCVKISESLGKVMLVIKRRGI